MKMSHIDLQLSALVFLYRVLQRTSGDVIVDTTVGQIRGYRATDGDYNMFLGVPYAAVNRSNPFGAAIAIPALEGVFEANDDTAVCPQREEYNNTLVGTLDCLNLNIYVPNVNTSRKPLAVIIYIYGGEFLYGFASKKLYGPSYFMKQNVILVTFNYRTGPFGFMCLDTPLVPGNQALKDQVLAMEWVNNNIAAFSGDHNKITLLGHSSGAACVDLHLLSKHDMLYDRVILQSGSSFCPIFSKPNKAAPFLLAEYFGRTFDDVNEVISFLATIDPLQVIQASYDLQITKSFALCIEKKIDGIQNFITEDWLRIKVMPKVENMTIMMGFTTDEYTLIYTNVEAKGFTTLKDIVEDRLVLGFDTEHEYFRGMSKTIRNYYMGDGEINIQIKQQIIDFHSDYTFIYPVHRSLERFLENDVRKVYLYRYGYMGTRNYALYCYHAINKTKGASHSDDLGYLFDMEFLPKPNTVDQLVIDMMTTMWANFAKYGDPTPVETSLLPVKWLPITNGSQYHFLDIDSELSPGSRPYHDRMAFWDLFYKANHHLQRLYPGAEPAGQV